MQPGQDLKQGAKGGGVNCVQEWGGGQRLAHSLRTGGSGPVPACVQPLPVGFNAGNEAKWAPVDWGDQTVRNGKNMEVSRKHGNERYV